MAEEHPRRRRALSWGEQPLTRVVQPQAQSLYRPTRQASQAGKTWVDFPDTVSAAHEAWLLNFLARAERIARKNAKRGK